MASKYRNAGQTCVCANRLLVQDGVYDAFADKLAAAVRQAEGRRRRRARRHHRPADQPGRGREGAGAHRRRRRQRREGRRRRQARSAAPSSSRRCLRDVTTDMLVAREETFGPVAPLFRFKTEDEAIAMANATEFGLACYFYTRDIGRVWRVAEALEYGMVGINEGIISTAEAPFGGVKESGIGREGSRHGVEEYRRDQVHADGRPRQVTSSPLGRGWVSRTADDEGEAIRTSAYAHRDD